MLRNSGAKCCRNGISGKSHDPVLLPSESQNSTSMQVHHAGVCERVCMCASYHLISEAKKVLFSDELSYIILTLACRSFMLYMRLLFPFSVPRLVEKNGMLLPQCITRVTITRP